MIAEHFCSQGTESIRANEGDPLDAPELTAVSAGSANRRAKVMADEVR
jgi:hypothetical protein